MTVEGLADRDGTVNHQDGENQLADCGHNA